MPIALSPLVRAAGLLAVVALAGTVACRQPDPPAFDLLITGGRIVDGTGSPWYYGDVAIRGDRIVAIGDLAGATSARRVEARGLVVAPGFIDMLGQSEFNLLVDNRAASKITQGITTEVTGEGTSIAPVNERMVNSAQPSYAHFGVVADWRTLGEYFRRLEERTHPAINVATLVGAGGVRDYVVGRVDRAATPAELEQMKRLVAQAMEDGALGLSSALQYVPDRFASTDELVELAKVARRYGGIYATHQRSEGLRIFESLDEVFAVADRAQIATEIYHLKTAYRPSWGKMPEVLRRIEAARRRGLDITANQYPYTRAANNLDSCLPIWAREGGIDKTLARLTDPAQRERIKREMDDVTVTAWENQWAGAGGAPGVLLVSVLNPALKPYEGLTLEDIGRKMGKDPRDAVMDLVTADRGESGCITSIMSEDDVRVALASPLVSVGTDAAARATDGRLAESRSHPRAWGSFARILGRYVRDEHLLSLEEAIRKMTSQPAARVHLADRGILRPGMAADITVFDPATIQDRASFEQPSQYSVGIRFVIVNGRAVVADGHMTTERPGRVLRGPGARRPR
jgi:dihydroorotase/N-acyl-D-amino-acid deacylase